jgi:hypothetical protein
VDPTNIPISTSNAVISVGPRAAAASEHWPPHIPPYGLLCSSVLLLLSGANSYTPSPVPLFSRTQSVPPRSSADPDPAGLHVVHAGSTTSLLRSATCELRFGA